jgi:hypothetical protein
VTAVASCCGLRSLPLSRFTAKPTRKTGAIKPAGWLKAELELQATGITGQIPSFWSYVNDTGWMGGKGSEPSQFYGYYMNGLACAFFPRHAHEWILLIAGVRASGKRCAAVTHSSRTLQPKLDMLVKCTLS